MSSGYNINPPNYTDPCVAGDISSLISTALAVQEGLFNARDGLKRIQAAEVNELLPRIVDIDERYLKLLNESRTSANDLYIAIQNFMDVAIPISQDARNPIEERVGIVKKFADKIAVSAHQDLESYDKQVEALKDNLNQLVADLTLIESTLKDQSKSTENLQPMKPTDATLKGHPRACHLYLYIVIVTFLASVVGWFVAPKAPVTKTPLKTTILLSSSAVDEAVLRDISALVVLFSSLVGKLGHFGAVWEKLVADSAELSVYLSHGIVDQDVIGNRVQAEVGVYEKIKQALDDYCLRTT